MPYGQRDRNPDLVENVSTADVDVLGRQRTLTEPKGKDVQSDTTMLW